MAILLSFESQKFFVPVSDTLSTDALREYIQTYKVCVSAGCANNRGFRSMNSGC